MFKPVCFSVQRNVGMAPSRVLVSRANVRHLTARNRGLSFVVRAVREYPDPDFIAEVIDSFPDKMIASAEEARVLFTEGGYKYLDVRPELEIDSVGGVRGRINVPVMNAKWEYNAEKKKKIAKKWDNEDFVKMVEKKIPNKDTPIIVGCSDGKSYSLDALGALDEAGYTCLVGLKGGFYAWNRVWDNNLRRRRTGEYAEQYTHDGDSCGIHSSGAGFERVDAIGDWAPPDFYGENDEE